MDQSVVIAIDHSPQSENAVKCELYSASAPHRHFGTKTFRHLCRSRSVLRHECLHTLTHVTLAA